MISSDHGCDGEDNDDDEEGEEGEEEEEEEDERSGVKTSVAVLACLGVLITAIGRSWSDRVEPVNEAATASSAFLDDG